MKEEGGRLAGRKDERIRKREGGKVQAEELMGMEEEASSKEKKDGREGRH